MPYGIIINGKLSLNNFLPIIRLLKLIHHTYTIQFSKNTDYYRLTDSFGNAPEPCRQ